MFSPSLPVMFTIISFVSGFCVCGQLRRRQNVARICLCFFPFLFSFGEGHCRTENLTTHNPECSLLVLLSHPHNTSCKMTGCYNQTHCDVACHTQLHCIRGQDLDAARLLAISVIRTQLSITIPGTINMSRRYLHLCIDNYAK